MHFISYELIGACLKGDQMRLQVLGEVEVDLEALSKFCPAPRAGCHLGSIGLNPSLVLGCLGAGSEGRQAKGGDGDHGGTSRAPEDHLEFLNLMTPAGQIKRNRNESEAGQRQQE